MKLSFKKFPRNLPWYSMRIVVIALLGNLILFSNGMAANDTTLLLQQGQNFYQHGHFAQAIEKWEMALNNSQTADFDTLLHLAIAYQALGNYPSAMTAFQQALSVAQQSGKPAQKVLVHSYLGDILLAMQQPEAAQVQLEAQLELARSLDNSSIFAHLLNNLSNVWSIQQEYNKALQGYQEVAQIAALVDNTTLQFQALNNQAHLYLKLNNLAESIALLKQALNLVPQLPNSHNKALRLLRLGQLMLRIQNHQSLPVSNEPLPIIKTYQIFREVLQLATQYQDKRLMSYAKGFLGQIYEHKRRYVEALQLTREAIFLAQKMPDILYLWEWQQARLWQTQQNLEAALAAYQRALVYLQPIRPKLSFGQRNDEEAFNERIRPVYYGLADVLLQQAARAASPSQKQKLLNQAREAVEQLKTVELQDYFQDDCVLSVQTPLTQLDHLTKQHKTAVLYPIILPQRTELLLSLPDGLHQVVTPVGYKTVKQEVVKFRRNLQNVIVGSFITQAKQLYNWFITPLEAKLSTHQINTLVIVPDGPLRTIPMAALYNASEKTFLFHHFALAITPSLTLTEPRRLPRNVHVLLNGLSEGVQGFSPLPSVIPEINNISDLFTKPTVFLNQAFSQNTISHALQKTPYEIIHISSHGQFDRNPKNSFLLTYKDKLTMNHLEKIFKLSDLRKEKVELLTLSACQTAVGDERAALGLAGVAIKAGARSALASLWFVDDEATSQLIVEFYRQLQNPTLSKAQALQNAQKKLATQPQFRHPIYWSPFLLIGNWL